MNFKKYVSVPSLSAFFLAVAPLVTSSLAGQWMLKNEAIVQNFTYTDWAALTFLCAFLAALALAPPTLLALCFGYFLGWWAFAPLLLLNLAAISLVYGLFGSFDARQLVAYFRKSPRTAVFFERIHQNELNFVFFTKLSPVLPFALTNLLFVLSGIKFKNVLLGGFLGMVPRTLLAIWVGKEARAIKVLLENPNESIWSRVVILALVVLSVWGLFRVFSARS